MAAHIYCQIPEVAIYQLPAAIIVETKETSTPMHKAPGNLEYPHRVFDRLLPYHLLELASPIIVGSQRFRQSMKRTYRVYVPSAMHIHQLGYFVFILTLSHYVT